MLAHILPWFGITLTLVVCGSAFIKGDREQQLAAGGLLISLAVTLAMRDRTWAGTQWAAFISDTLLLGLMISIALRSRRYWPLAAAAFQLLCVFTHLARIIDPGVRAWAYATGQVIWSQLVFWAVGVGVWGTWRREAGGVDGTPSENTPAASRRGLR